MCEYHTYYRFEFVMTQLSEGKETIPFISDTKTNEADYKRQGAAEIASHHIKKTHTQECLQIQTDC